jgi:RNA polymerase sigma-70 factor (ECF subfamily)
MVAVEGIAPPDVRSDVRVCGAAEARFAAIWERHYCDVEAYARRRLSEGAEDVCPDVFLVAWRRLDEIPDDPLPWLYAVARNIVGVTWRAQARRSALIERVAGEPAPGQALPAEDERAVELVAALNRLAEHERELLLLVYWEGLTTARAAVALGVPAATIRTRLWRARARLRAQLRRRRSQHA